MNVGDKLKRRLKVYDADRKAGGAAAEVIVDATVVYIHPERRFDLGHGRSFRESFFFKN